MGLGLQSQPPDRLSCQHQPLSLLDWKRRGSTLGRAGRSARLRLLRQLRRARLNTSAQVLRLHEQVCFRAGASRRRRRLEGGREGVGRVRPSGAICFDIGRGSPTPGSPAPTSTTCSSGRQQDGWPPAGRPGSPSTGMKSIEPQLLAASLPLLVSPVEANWLRVDKPPPKEALARLGGKTSDRCRVSGSAG